VKDDRPWVTFYLLPDLAKGIKRAAAKKSLSQADYVDSVIRPVVPPSSKMASSNMTLAIDPCRPVTAYVELAVSDWLKKDGI
jgi:hypothetical protein